MNREVIDRLARIETKLDGLVKREDGRDNRLTAVERKQWYHSGALALAVFILSKLGLPVQWHI